MKYFVSWNVNGLRAAVKKGFEDFFTDSDADIFAIQETKLQFGQSPFSPADYHEYWNYAEKKGYSGTAVFSKEEPLNVLYGIGQLDFDKEGRVITLEFDEFFFVCVYTPNAQHGLARIEYRLAFEDAFRSFLLKLVTKKEVCVCGDMNVAHEPIDLARPKENVGHAGFSDAERGKMDELLAAGFVDSFRFLYPKTSGAYSWWSYRAGARARNVGWRIDYFLLSRSFEHSIKAAQIHSEVYGSDHCPISLTLDL